MVDITVDGQQLFCDIFIVVIRRAKQNRLCFLGFVYDLIPRIARVIADSRDFKYAVDEVSHLPLKPVNFQIKRNVTCLDRRSRLIACRNCRSIKTLEIFIQLLFQHVDCGICPLIRRFNRVRRYIRVIICMGNVQCFDALHELHIVHIVHAAGIRQHPINQVSLVDIVDHV